MAINYTIVNTKNDKLIKTNDPILLYLAIAVNYTNSLSKPALISK